MVLPFLGRSEVTFRDFELWGTFAPSAPDGSTDRMTDTSFSTVVDVRDLGISCPTLRLLFSDAQCSTCPHDSESSECLVFYVTGLQAEPVEGVSVVEWTDEQVAGNPDCPQ